MRDALHYWSTGEAPAYFDWISGTKPVIKKRKKDLIAETVAEAKPIEEGLLGDVFFEYLELPANNTSPHCYLVRRWIYNFKSKK